MKDIGLTAVEAHSRIQAKWDEVKTHRDMMDLREIELADLGKNRTYDDEWQRLERLKLEAIRQARDIEGSGAIPWIEDDGLGSFDPDMEVWARRVMGRVHQGDSQYEYERLLVVTMKGRQFKQDFSLSRSMAEELRDQLIYELGEWEESV